MTPENHPLNVIAPDTWKNIPLCLTFSTKQIIQDCYRTFDKLTEITKVINKFKQEVDLRFANFHNEFLRVEKSTDQKYVNEMSGLDHACLQIFICTRGYRVLHPQITFLHDWAIQYLSGASRIIEKNQQNVNMNFNNIKSQINIFREKMSMVEDANWKVVKDWASHEAKETEEKIRKDFAELLDQRDQQIKESIQAIEERHGTLETDKNSISQMIKSTDAKISKIQEQISKSSFDLAKKLEQGKEASILEINNKILNLKQEINQNIHNQIEEFEERNKPEEISESEPLVSQNEFDQLEGQVSSIQNAIEQLKKMTEVNQIQSQVSTVQQEINSFCMRFKSLEDTLSNVQKEISELKPDEEKKDEKSEHSQEEKDKDNFKEVIDRLQDLESKFDSFKKRRPSKRLLTKKSLRKESNRGSPKPLNIKIERAVSSPKKLNKKGFKMASTLKKAQKFFNKRSKSLSANKRKSSGSPKQNTQRPTINNDLNQSVDYRYQNRKMSLNVKYHNEVKNSYRKVEFPLLSNHHVTPAAYASLNQSIAYQEELRRHAKTPMVSQFMQEEGFLDNPGNRTANQYENGRINYTKRGINSRKTSKSKMMANDEAQVQKNIQSPESMSLGVSYEPITFTGNKMY
ncbi:unnamed protein product [Moneuplotes crassus]|uniref:Uncharacterized protein n=1 Tax=Euplotes crassus TaxID=5936 RepID=A0AAD2DBG0_EUPCR|nr:unnamed protein product [Moneuplotes crassus]